MNANLLLLAFSLLATSLLAAAQTHCSIIPLPQKVEPGDGAFVLQSTTPIILLNPDATSVGVANVLAEPLRRSTGYPLKVSATSKAGSDKGAILLILANPGQIPSLEGYELTITGDSVIIRAANGAGLFYGAQSLLQLLPPEVLASKPIANKTWNIPAIHIEDYPRFAWRGFLLDVGRHFFTTAEIKQLLDLMALHKLNVFHWHLTDDQG